MRRSESGSGTLTIRHSKTNPEGEGRVQYLSPATMNALDKIRPDEATGSIFRLSAQQIDRRIKAADGAELPALMHAGRWKSARMPARYTEHQTAQRGAVARFYGQ